MQVQRAIRSVFGQLSESLRELSPQQYTQPLDLLFNATIGKHVRHTIELFVCLEEGYHSGRVNYEKRNRDINIETDKNYAIELLQKICNEIEKPDKSLILEANFDERAEVLGLKTNFYRELVYNLEHTVHHMALIRIGISDISQITVPENFGVAFSTMKHRKASSSLRAEG
jgi:hypothetical protein